VLQPVQAWLGRVGQLASEVTSPWPRIALALPLAGAAAVAVVMITETSYQRSTDALERLGQRAQATLRMNALDRRLLDAESSQRGYLLTGRSSYLEPYREAARDIADQIAWLQRHFEVDDPGSAALLARLQGHARAKTDELAQTIAAYDGGDTARWQAIVTSGKGDRELAAFRELSRQLMLRERQHVAEERQDVLETLGTSRLGVNITAAVGLLVLVMVLRQTAALEAVRERHTRALQAERQRLEAEASARTADLTELAKHLQTVREDESHRLASNLHDELGALLTTTKLDVARLRRSLADAAPEVLARLGHLNHGIDSGIALKRRIIEDLRPSSLSNLGLVSALEIQLRDFSERSGLKVQHELQAVALTDSAQITVYRLVQESLTNIAKYAQARRVTVALDSGPAGKVDVTVADDGVGFDPKATRRSAHGLMGMRYRVEAVGGTLTIHSAPGRGTRLVATLPQAAQATPAQGVAT